MAININFKFKLILFLFFCLSGVFSVVKISNAEINIIENSSFEVGDTKWQYYSNRKLYPLSVGIDNTVARTGSNSIKFEADTNTGRKVINTQIYYLKPNTQYTASAYYRRPGPEAAYVSVDIGVKKVNSDNAFTNVYTRITPTIEDGDWHRYSVAFTTTAYTGYYIELNVVESSYPGAYVWIDDVHLEEGSTPTIYAPASNVELGWSTTSNGNVFYTTDVVQLNLKVRNDSISQQTGSIKYEVYDFWNSRISDNSSDIIINPNTTIINSINLPNTKGAYRIVAWWSGANKTLSETTYSVVPVPRGHPFYASSFTRMFGSHIPFYDYYLNIAKRLGLGWSREMSTGNQTRWAVAEATNDNFTYYDSELALAKTHGIEILANLFGEFRVMPSWAEHVGTNISFNDNNPSNDTIVISADVVSKFANGEEILVARTNTSGDHINDVNNGIYVISSINYSAPNTIITLTSEVALTTASNGNTFHIMNLNEWDEFVAAMINHYKSFNSGNNSIKYWEVWNEPSSEGGLGTCSGGVCTGDDLYANILGRTNAIIKANDANAKVAGMVSSLIHYMWNNEVIARIGNDDFDYLSTHGYADTNQGINADNLNNILTSNNKDGWNTETGIQTYGDYYIQPYDLYKSGTEIINWGTHNHQRTTRVILENIFHTLVGNINKYFYYDFRATIDSSNILDRSLLNANGTVQYPAVVYAIVANLFDEAVSVGTRLTLPSYLTGVMWEDSNSTPWVIMWTDLSLRQVVTANNYSVYDIMGNLVSASTNIINLNGMPIYVKSNGVNKITIQNDFNAASYSTRTDITSPNVVVIMPTGNVQIGDNVRISFFAYDKDNIVTPNNPNDIQYRWKLEGVDNDWTNWSSNMYVYYNNIQVSSLRFNLQVKDIAENIANAIYENGTVIDAVPPGAPTGLLVN